MTYVFHIVVLVEIYAILALSLNPITGRLGLLSVSQAAFFGVGAYGAALAPDLLGLSWWQSVGASLVIACALGFCVGAIALRLKEEFFVIASIGFQVLFFGFAQNLTSVTGGPLGVAGIGRPRLGGDYIDTNGEFALLALFGLVAVLLVDITIERSLFGLCLRGIATDAGFMTSVGRRPFWYKELAFMWSALGAALAGGIYAAYVRYIDPSTFTVYDSILILGMVIIGGAGSPWGVILGAAVVIVIPELLRLTNLPASIEANVRQILYGVLMVVVVLWRPAGILGSRRRLWRDA